MKILVPIKRVVDYNIKVRAKSDCSMVDIENVKMSINPFDEIAVEEAIRLKEKNLAAEIIVVTIGPNKAEDILRTALAMGADRAILVETNEETSPLPVAKILKNITLEQKIDLVIMGKQAIDDDCNQTGQMLSALLAWPQATFASKIELKDRQAIIDREVDSGTEVIKVTLPAIITTDLRLNEPRYVTLPNIMKARSKPLDKKKPSDFNVSLQTNVKTIKVEEPKKRVGGKKVADVNELVAKLKEAGVL